MGACISLGSSVQSCCQHDDYTKGLSRKHIQKLRGANLENTPLGTYDFTSVKVLDVIDGDTFQIAAMHDEKLTRFTVRLYGVDTPEMSSKDPAELARAEEATAFTQKMIGGKLVHIEVLTNKRVYDKSKKGRIVKGKYGRLLANVYIGELSLAGELIKRNLGKPYFGGTK